MKKIPAPLAIPAVILLFAATPLLRAGSGPQTLTRVPSSTKPAFVATSPAAPANAGCVPCQKGCRCVAARAPANGRA